MKVPFVDLYAQYLSVKPEIDNAIADVIANSDYIKGKHVQNFENSFANLHGVKHCISVANGTDAIYIALKMMGIGTGDEVITTSLSWISTSETISQTGAKPVFIDIDPRCLTINTALIEEKINKNTKAIIPVHLHGQCAEMDPILELAKKYNLRVIEDNAQAHFAIYKGKLAGTMGHVSTFSFYPGKNLGAYGDAGAILTNDNELASKMRMYANHGALIKHQHKMEGINSRLDGLQAAILNVKLKHIQQWTEKRIANAKYLNELLIDIRGLEIPFERSECKHVYHVYCIKTKRRNELKDHLEKNNVNVAIHYPVALPNMEAYQYIKNAGNDFSEATQSQDTILSLPMYAELTKAQMEYVALQIKAFFK